MGSLDSCWLPHQEASAATHLADISDTCPEPTLAVPPTRSSMAWPLRDGAVDWLGDKGCIPMVHRLIDGSSIPIHRFERIKGQEFRTSSFRRASCQPVAGFRCRPVEKTACHCGDCKAPRCPIVIGRVSPLRSSISNSGASRGETPLCPVTIDARQQPTDGGASAPPRNARLAGLAFTGAAPDGIPVLADNSTDSATDKCIGAAHGGCCYGRRAR